MSLSQQLYLKAFLDPSHKCCVIKLTFYSVVVFMLQADGGENERL
jgi:hypothetical protein